MSLWLHLQILRCLRMWQWTEGQKMVDKELRTTSKELKAKVRVHQCLTALSPCCSLEMERMISNVAANRMVEVAHAMGMPTSSCCKPVVKSWWVQHIWRSDAVGNIEELHGNLDELVRDGPISNHKPNVATPHAGHTFTTKYSIENEKLEESKHQCPYHEQKVKVSPLNNNCPIIQTQPQEMLSVSKHVAGIKFKLSRGKKKKKEEFLSFNIKSFYLHFTQCHIFFGNKLICDQVKQLLPNKLQRFA